MSNIDALGYDADAMVVWDVPDEDVDRIGEQFKAVPWVTLCYRRPRVPTRWPCDLFCMIHGRDRAEVLGQIDQMVEALDLQNIDRDVLFSTHCYKQRGGHYATGRSAAHG
ncbi:MAG: hypothetical protein U5O39_11210 [Gammaproteobacteria bacterium]|nr:hypothetical protein [Gammaproteobacteria bacterium]